MSKKSGWADGETEESFGEGAEAGVRSQVPMNRKIECHFWCVWNATIASIEYTGKKAFL